MLGRGDNKNYLKNLSNFAGFPWHCGGHRTIFPSPSTLKGIVVNPVHCFRSSWPSPPMLERLVTNPTCCQRNFHQPCPIPPAPKGTLTNAAHSQTLIQSNPISSKTSFDKSYLFMKKFWPILSDPPRLLTNPFHLINPTLSWKKSDQSYPLLNELWTIIPGPKGNLTSDQCCPLP